MPEALIAALPLVLAAVLVASGIAKLRTPDDLAGWETLGVPAALRQTWLLRLHPWGEIVLGAAVALLGGWLGVLASLVALALMLAYTVLVARVASKPEDASCACFGAQKRVTRVTVARNVWLAILAAASAAVVWAGPLLGGALAVGIRDWAWLVGLAVAAVTVALILWPEQTIARAEPAPASSTAPSSASADSQDEYVRTRTPAVPITLADGTPTNLRILASHKPLLVLAVSPTCASCVPVIDKVAEYRKLMPQLDVRLLLTSTPEDSPMIELDEPQSLHDPYGNVRDSIADWFTPTAVLFGADGLLAGGPVTGAEEIDVFFDDIYESLHGVRPERQATA